MHYMVLDAMSAATNEWSTVPMSASKLLGTLSCAKLKREGRCQAYTCHIAMSNVRPVQYLQAKEILLL